MHPRPETQTGSLYHLANRGRWLLPLSLLACGGDSSLPNQSAATDQAETTAQTPALNNADSTGNPSTDNPDGLDSPAPFDPNAPSLVLITMDTTRADRIGSYGHEHAKTPAIDQFAKEGVQFERAYATVPLTIPSHASMLTSLYPTRHGVHNNGDAILPESVETLAEALKKHGYQTAASVSAFVTTRAWNFDQGFDGTLMISRPLQGQGRWSSERRADGVVDDLIGWLDEAKADQPALIWAHFYDPHDPYHPPESMREEFPRRVYDGEIAFMDRQIARLRDAIQNKLGDNVAWVLVADHGEAFNGQHGEQTHGLYLYDPTMRIPFILRPAQGLETPVVVEELAVSNVDVMTCALGRVGSAPPEGLDGVDLSPFGRGEVVERPPVYLESENVTQRFGFAPEIAVVEREWKLMDTPNALLFNTVTDPGEKTNLLSQQPDIVERLKAVSEAVQSAQEEEHGGDIAPELMEELMALGYISHDVQDQGAMSDIDAKDHRQIVRELEQALQILRVGEDPKKSEALYRKILKDYSSLGEARLGLARALNHQDRKEEAEQVLREAVELQPQSTVLRTNLANNLAAQGRHDEGLALMQSVLDQVPEDDLARTGILRMLTDLKRYDEAIKLASEWLQKDPKSHGLKAHIGVAMARSGDLSGAIPFLQGSLEDAVPRQLVHRMLAQDLMTRNDLDGAIEHLKLEVEYFSRDGHAHGELAMLYAQKSQTDLALEHLEKALELGVSAPGARLAVAQLLFNQRTYDASRITLAPALQSEPSNPFVLKLHAELLAKEGRKTEATAVFERAQALLNEQQERVKSRR